MVIEYDKHNRRDSYQILLNDKDQQVLIVSCTVAAKSAIYDCVVVTSGMKCILRDLFETSVIGSGILLWLCRCSLVMLVPVPMLTRRLQ